MILPRVRLPRDDWDNQSNLVIEDVATIGECRQVCSEDEACLQFSFDTESLICSTSHSITYGEARLGSGLYSEWMFDRVEEWRNSQRACTEESYLYYGDADEGG